MGGLTDGNSLVVSNQYLLESSRTSSTAVANQPSPNSTRRAVEAADTRSGRNQSITARLGG